MSQDVSEIQGVKEVKEVKTEVEHLAPRPGYSSQRQLRLGLVLLGSLLVMTFPG